MSDYEGVSSIISAIATVLLAVVAQMFSMERGREAKRGEMRSQLIDANAQIDVEFAFLFFRSRGYMAPDGVQYMHGGDFESALDKNHTHPSTKTAVARVQLIRFLEALRGASLVFDEVVNNDFKGNPPRAVWRGKYDSATSNLRLGFEIFEKFYNHSVMGRMEEHQEFFHDAIASPQDWRVMQKTAASFIQNPKLYWDAADNYSSVDTQVSIRPADGYKE